MKTSEARRLIRKIEPGYDEMFSGKVYSIGKGAASVRNHSGYARETVIGVHGFLCNQAYFTQSYQDPTTELILITNCNYHIPASGVEIVPAPWQYKIMHPEMTIEYDACLLNQALEFLPSSDRVRVHGHSRGAAVILQAMAMRPDLFRNVDVLLEAPVLPQGRLHKLALALLIPLPNHMWPWVVKFFNCTRNTTYSRLFYGGMNPRKEILLDRMWSSTRDHLTIVRNIENILGWMDRTGFEIYNHMKQGTILIPTIDRILDRSAMLNSARKTPNRVRIIETDALSHFITLDDEKWIPPFQHYPLSMPA